MKQIIKDCFLYSILFLLLLASFITPLVLITFWLLPLPFFILFVKHHWKATGICGLILTMIVLWIHPLVCLFVIYGFLIGSVMGRNYRKLNTSGTDVILGGIVIACICSWLFLIIGEAFFDIMNLLRRLWDQLPDEQTFFAIETVLPFMLFIPTVATPLSTFFLGRYILSRQGYAKKYLPMFRNWRLPRIFFYFYLILLVILLMIEEVPVLVGIVSILQLLFFIQGFSFVAFLLHYYRKSKLWIIPILLAVFVPYLFMIVLLLGVIDTSFRVREWLMSKK